MEPAQIIKRNDFEINNYNLKAAFISVTVTLMMFFSVLFSVPVLEVKATTAETDIRAFIQTELDKMSSEIVISVKKNEDNTYDDIMKIAKLFIETNSNGDIIINTLLPENERIKATAFTKNIINNTLLNMQSDNFNAYTRLAIKPGEENGIKIYISVNSELDSNGKVTRITNLEIKYSISWADGENALDARDYVIEHAKKFLNSPSYPSSKSVNERINSINKFICETFQYDYRLFVEEEMDDVIYSAYQMINDTEIIGGHPIGGYPRGVCQAYAMYGYIILNEAFKNEGIHIITVDGKARDENHAWNMAKINGNWYHIDFTWNDPIRDDVNTPSEFITYKKRQNGEGEVSTKYLLKTDSYMSDTHVWDKSIFPPPATPTHIPTKAPTPVPTKSITPTIAPSSSQSSSTADESIQSGSEISEDETQSSRNESSSNLPTATPVPINMITSDNSENFALNSEEKTVTISGFLYDVSGEPIPGILVELFATSMTRRTTSKGYFEFKGVKVGNYKIYVKDYQGNELAEMPVVISFGDITEYDSGEITVRGGRLDMNLVFDGEKLSIRSVSSPKNIFTVPTIIGIITLLLIAAAFAAIVLRKKEKVGVSEYLD